MQHIFDVAQQIIAREGGFVNDPDDPGGATKYGVTLKTLQTVWAGRPGPVGLAQLRALTRKQAARIFIEYYFQAPGIDRLPTSIQPSVFDMFVNAGANAVRILQRLLVEMGQAVQVDGLIGPQTSAAAHRAQTAAPGFFADAYGIARRNYYYRLADQRPASRKYARRRDGGKGGWIRRAEEFISPKYRLSAAEHAQRVRAWG